MKLLNFSIMLVTIQVLTTATVAVATYRRVQTFPSATTGGSTTVLLL